MYILEVVSQTNRKDKLTMNRVSNINDLLKVLTHCYLTLADNMSNQGLNPIGCKKVAEKLCNNIKGEDYEDYSYVEAKLNKMVKTWTGKVERLSVKVSEEPNRFFRDQLTKDSVVLTLLTQGKQLLDDWFDTRMVSEEIMFKEYEITPLTVTAPSPSEGQSRSDFEDHGPLFPGASRLKQLNWVR